MDIIRFVRAQWDRVGAWLLIVAGVVALILGWIGASGTAYTAEQLPYVISGGIGGIFLLGMGAMLWLSADLQDEWAKLDRVEQLLEEQAARAVTSSNGSEGTTGKRSPARSAPGA